MPSHFTLHTSHNSHHITCNPLFTMRDSHLHLSPSFRKDEEWERPNWRQTTAPSQSLHSLLSPISSSTMPSFTRLNGNTSTDPSSVPSRNFCPNIMDIRSTSGYHSTSNLSSPLLEHF